MEFFIISMLNGLSYGLLLFMLSSGLTLIFSMMGVLNFAHASFYMIGAYIGYTLNSVLGFWVALLVAPILVGALGAMFERLCLRRVHKFGHVPELLVTFGLSYIVLEVVQLVWGRTAVEFVPPPSLQGPAFTLVQNSLNGLSLVWGAAAPELCSAADAAVRVVCSPFPATRGFMMLVALMMMVGLWLLLKRTRVGLVIQAALTHPEAVEALGHNVPRVFMMVFGVGTGLAGLAGDDTYVVDNTGDRVEENSNEGTADTVEASITYALTANVENLTLTTGAGNINGTGNSLDNTITGNSGDNTLNGDTGADTMAGGAGNDTYIVDNTDDSVTEAANSGTDTVQSSVNYTLGDNLENLTLTGTTATAGTGNTLDNILIANNVGDTLVGLVGNDTLTGGAGNDTLDGGTGNDTMAGGAGNDTYIVDNTGDSVTEAANSGTDTVQSSVNYTLTDNVENLTLTGSATAGTGNALANTLIANNAGDTLSGMAGDDTLTGGTGNDILIGGVGADNLNGGAGTDTASYVGSSSAVIVSLAANAINSGGDAAGDTLSNIENLTGSSNDDTLTGDGGANVLDGGLGNDKLIGGAGNDIYIVNSTGDVITEAAGAGTDTVRISGITSFNLGAIQATNIENLDLKTDTSANNVTLSSSAIKALVNLGNSSILSLSLGSNDSYQIAAESNVFFTDTRGSTTFYSDAAKTAQIAQVIYV